MDALEQDKYHCSYCVILEKAIAPLNSPVGCSVTNLFPSAYV
jgi:hypothetical protein